MKIEEGKFYRTRDGRKVGPMRGLTDRELSTYTSRWVWMDGSRLITAPWDDAGTFSPYRESKEDLIAEWTDGPVREVTRKEIVGGTYGRIWFDREIGSHIQIDLVNTAGKRQDESRSHLWSLEELRAAASTLTAIADALEETK